MLLEKIDWKFTLYSAMRGNCRNARLHCALELVIFEINGTGRWKVDADVVYA